MELLALVYLRQLANPGENLAAALAGVVADRKALAAELPAIEKPDRDRDAAAAKQSVIDQLTRERADAERADNAELVARIDAELAKLGG